jgi:hypothetical protein
MQQECGYGWFKLADYHQGVVVYDRVLPHNNQYFHHGIGMDMILEADSIESAENQGRSSLGLLFSLISFCTNTEVSSPEEQLIIEYDQDLDSRDYRQILDQKENKPTIGTVRAINEDFFVELYNEIYSDDFTESDRRKLSRSLHRYSSALRQQTATDQFVWLFIAFDALEDLFVDKYGIDAIVEYPCDECGAVNTGPDSSAGMRHFVDKCANTSLSYSDLRDIRGSLFHGGPIKDAADHVEEMANIYRQAFLDVLNVSSEDYDEELQLGINGHMRDEKIPLTGKLKGYQTLPLENFVQQPGAELEEFEVSFEINGELLTRKLRPKITFPEELGVDRVAVMQRPLGNVGTPKNVRVTDFEMEEY